MQGCKPPDRQDNGHTSAGTGDYRHDPCQPGSRPPRSSYCHRYPGHMPHQRSQMLCRGHRTPSPASLWDRPERTASGCGSGEHAPPSLLWLRHQSEQLHGSSRTDRLRRDRSSAAHRPTPRLPGLPSTNWPHSAAPHRSCRHNPGCADPHKPGPASGVSASGAGHSPPTSHPDRTAMDRSLDAAARTGHS